MNDTIAAISTAYGTGAIGIIRLSGPMSFHIAARIFKSEMQEKGKSANGGNVGEKNAVEWHDNEKHAVGNRTDRKHDNADREFGNRADEDHAEGNCINEKHDNAEHTDRKHDNAERADRKLANGKLANGKLANGKLVNGKLANGKSFDEIKTHSVNYGFIVDPSSGERIDEVLLTKMKGPASYTREDVIEINCHAGFETLESILDLVIREGARTAEPGEFTKRAFLNGRIDLTQAEAVMDIINATAKLSAKAALNQLEGVLSARLKAARNGLLDIIASIDAVLDFPEHDLEEVTAEDALARLSSLDIQLRELESGFKLGGYIRDGASCVITGKPNVGKSTLLNLLARRERAIVAEAPGTTRDLIRENTSIGGFPVNIVDTAGIREAGDPVERIGVDIAEATAAKADISLILLDSSRPLDEDDRRVIDISKHAPHIYLINKIDIATTGGVETAKIFIRENDEYGNAVLETSLKDGIGLSAIEEQIIKMFGKGEVSANNEALLTNKRHHAQVMKSINAISDAISAVETKLPIDIATIGIKEAVSALGEITGEDCLPEVIDRIFENFCLGK
ncbi:MAG: tRNA uridine-5-carboxymethylaminomethyl(34) synthesis GTPase MnmE [Synergistaceae bacterium]|nr:tRNA uridine-5-carboxymethylaminomethyl(34) synthesis GTPase MnmE [Synergistaceae bacterium]